MDRGTIVLTGATGVVGMEVLARLLEAGDDDVVVLLRAADQEAADARLAATLERVWDTPPAGLRVRAMCADVTAPRLGISAGDRRELARCADRVMHCAAAVGFDQPLPDALAVNTLGTQRVLELAHALPHLRRLVHVSTAYVSGQTEGVFRETDLVAGQSFRNTYEQTKHLAERLVSNSDLPVVIARPSIVVGDGATGWTPAFSALYLPLRAFARGLLDRVPADPDGLVDAVPLDYVAGSIVHLLEAAGIDGNTYCLVAGDRAARVADVLALAQQRFAQPAPTFAPLRIGGGTQALVPYFDVKTQFDDSGARALLEPAGLSSAPLDALFERLMDYAEATRWGRVPTTRETALRRAAGDAPLEEVAA
jgi:thioester reductase-like protein